MAHHGEDNRAFAAMREEMLKRIEGAHQLQQEINQILGPSLPSGRHASAGQFPEGQLNEADEGEIRVAIGRQNGKVVIDFGKPVAWIGFTAQQAREIAELLISHAEGVEAGQ